MTYLIPTLISMVLSALLCQWLTPPWYAGIPIGALVAMVVLTWWRSLVR